MARPLWNRGPGGCLGGLGAMVTFHTVGDEVLSVLGDWSEPVPQPRTQVEARDPDEHPFGAAIEWRSLRRQADEAVSEARSSGSSVIVAIFARPRRHRLQSGASNGFSLASMRSALRAWHVGEDDVVALGTDMVGVVLPDWHPDGLANLADAMSVRPGMPAFVWGASLYPGEGENADDLLSGAVARLGLAESEDVPELAALAISESKGRGLFVTMAALALATGVLIPVTMSSGPPPPLLPPAAAEHFAAGSSPAGPPPSASSGSGAATSGGAASGSTQPTGSLLAGVGGSAPGVVPSRSGADAAGSSSSPSNAGASSEPGQGTGLPTGGSGSNGVSTSSTPTTTPAPPTTTPPTTTPPPPPTTTTPTTTTPPPTTTTTVPSHSGGGCILIFCG